MKGKKVGLFSFFHLQVPASVPASAAALRATTRERIDIDLKTLLKEIT